MRKCVRICVVSGAILACGCTAAPGWGREAPADEDSFHEVFAIGLVERARQSAGAWIPRLHRYADAYARPTRWLVKLTGCVSTTDGKTGPSPLPAPSWLLEPLDEQPTASINTTTADGQCSSTVSLPALGRWRITKTVPDAQGNPVAAVRERTFRDVLVAAVGDSYASGEGNPDHGKSFTDQQCHRSGRAWPARVAKSLEDDSTTVTFLSFACSGAEIGQLGYSHYDGIESGPALPPQVTALRRALGGPLVDDTRTVDVLLGDAGGNDAGFSGILKNCATNPDCQRDVSMRKIGPAYEALDEAISANLKVGSIYFVGYPSLLFTNGRGDPATCGAFDLMNTSDAEWVTATGDRLNAVIAAYAKAGGWTFVPTRERFRGHGLCASEVPLQDLLHPPSPLPADWRVSYFNTISKSLLTQDDIEGTAHPNEGGHRWTASEVGKMVRADVPPPTTQRLTLRFLRVRVTDLGRDPGYGGSFALRWSGAVTLGMRWYRNSCGHTEEVVGGLTARRTFPNGSSAGWTDISARPCLSFPITTAGRSFDVHAAMTLKRINYSDAQISKDEEVPSPDRSYRPSRVHRRTDPWVKVGAGGLARTVYRQSETHGFGGLDIEYEITSQPQAVLP